MSTPRSCGRLDAALGGLSPVQVLAVGGVTGIRWTRWTIAKNRVIGVSVPQKPQTSQQSAGAPEKRQAIPYRVRIVVGGGVGAGAIAGIVAGVLAWGPLPIAVILALVAVILALVIVLIIVARRD